MAAAAIPLVLPPEPAARRTGTWGMGLLIATEASLFGYLLFSYFYVGALAHGGWPPTGAPSLRLSLPNTFVLLLSSATAYWAESGIRRGRTTRLRLGLLVTLVLGSVFLAVQGIEFRNNPVRPGTNAYGSLFFTVTGFHAAHVAVGLLMLLVVLIRALLGHFRTGRHEAVTNVTWYWHFVDVVWLAVFTSLYLVPRFG